LTPPAEGVCFFQGQCKIKSVILHGEERLPGSRRLVVIVLDPMGGLLREACWASYQRRPGRALGGPAITLFEQRGLFGNPIEFDVLAAGIGDGKPGDTRTRSSLTYSTSARELSARTCAGSSPSSGWVREPPWSRVCRKLAWEVHLPERGGSHHCCTALSPIGAASLPKLGDCVGPLKKGAAPHRTSN
jgi:hypothetical protein